MEQFNNLIINLITVQLVANDIHYLCHGEAFYGKHIFVDEIKFNDEIDSIREVCLLGRGIRPLQNVEYYKRKQSKVRFKYQLSAGKSLI